MDIRFRKTLSLWDRMGKSCNKATPMLTFIPLHCCNRQCCSSPGHLLLWLWRRSEGRSPCGRAASHLPSTSHHKIIQTCNCRKKRSKKRVILVCWCKAIYWSLIRICTCSSGTRWGIWQFWKVINMFNNRQIKETLSILAELNNPEWKIKCI